MAEKSKSFWEEETEGKSGTEEFIIPSEAESAKEDDRKLPAESPQEEFKEKKISIKKENPKEKLDISEYIPSKKKDLEPEEKELRQRNKKDYVIISVLVVIIAALVGAVTAFLYNSNNREIYSLIDSGSYAVAFKEIEELHGNGENVDELLKTYIDACLADNEYKRAIQAVRDFSEAAYNDIEYYACILTALLDSNKSKQAEELIGYLSGKNSELDAVLAEVRNKYVTY